MLKRREKTKHSRLDGGGQITKKRNDRTPLLWARLLGRSRVTFKVPILGDVEIDAPGLVAITAVFVVGLVLLAPTALKAFELVVAHL
jgi:hypothetical protein